MRKQMKKAVAVVPATLLLAMAMPTSAFAVSGYAQDFEKDTAGWEATEGTFTRTAQGSGRVASSGSHYAVMSEAGAFTRFAGYSDQWDGAWSTTTDVYLDPAWGTGAGFDYSVAATGSDGKHLRDFILHAAKDGDELLVAASNNSNNGNVRTDLDSRHHAVIDEAGWYTVQHSFYEEDGHLAVDVQLLDSDGKVVFTEHLANAADTMDKVGGNRYGWFPVLEGTELAIDNVRVTRVDQDAAQAYATTFDGVGITANKTDRWHMSGSFDAAIVKQGGDAMLRISNATTSGSFGNQLFSPELTTAATESATNNVFNASFVVEPTVYQEGLQVTVSPDDGHGARDGWLRLSHVNGGLTIETMHWFLDDDAELALEYVPVVEGLDISSKHTVDMQVVKVLDTGKEDVNDVFRVSVDGGTWFKGETFEAYYNAVRAEEDPVTTVDPAVDALLFRMSGTANPALQGKGFLIDDVSMSVTTQAPPTKPTPPVKPTPPAKPAAPKVKVKSSATAKKDKLVVNVDPNRGSGYWRFQVQKLTPSGWKTLPGSYRTYGNYETRTLNLSKGTYRAVVAPAHGHTAGVSKSVHLTK
jgi:hypothetical protein